MAGLHYWSLGIAWGSGTAASRIQVAGRCLPDRAPLRDVHGERERRTEGHYPARQAGYTALATNSDADFLHCSSLVVNEGVGQRPILDLSQASPPHARPALLFIDLA